jgi:uncharacterized protein (DUF885 family)
MTRNLKDDMKKNLCQRSDFQLDVAFHKSFLSAGNMPLSFLRDVFQHNGLISS